MLLPAPLWVPVHCSCRFADPHPTSGRAGSTPGDHDAVPSLLTEIAAPTSVRCREPGQTSEGTVNPVLSGDALSAGRSAVLMARRRFIAMRPQAPSTITTTTCPARLLPALAGSGKMVYSCISRPTRDSPPHACTLRLCRSFRLQPRTAARCVGCGCELARYSRSRFGVSHQHHDEANWRSARTIKAEGLENRVSAGLRVTARAIAA